MKSIESDLINFNNDLDIYYEVDSFKTQNKILAFEKANGNLNQIRFNLYDHVYDKISWKEPLVSFQELIDNHIRWIRDTYKYVVLWYSGGFDSQTILESFIRTRSKIDEVIIYKRDWQSKLIDIEHDYTYDFIKMIKNKVYPTLKITSLCYRANDTFNFYKEHGIDWIYNIVGESIYFAKSSRLNLWSSKQELYEKFDPNYRIDIDGFDKPRLELKDGNWYFYMKDKNLVAHMGTNHEHFFMGKQAPLINVKQAHLAATWFESLPNFSIDLMELIQTQTKKTPLYREWNLRLGRSDAINSFAKDNIFKINFIQHFNVNRTESMMLMNRSYDESISKTYLTGLEKIKEFCIDKDPRKGLPAIDSKKYFLRKANFNAQELVTI